MLQFIIGLIVGGTVGFGVCAFLSVAKDERRTEAPRKKQIGDNDV